MIETLTLDYTDTVPFKRKRVLLIDDHVVVRKGLAMLINEEFDMQVCGEAEDERSRCRSLFSLPDLIRTTKSKISLASLSCFLCPHKNPSSFSSNPLF